MIVLFLILFTPSHAFANINGSDLQIFNPNTNGLDHITVHSTKTLDPLLLNVSGFVSYARNSLPYSILTPNPESFTISEPGDEILYSHLTMSLGLMEAWDMGVYVGLLNSQTVESSDNLFSYGNSGFDHLRVHTKYRFFQRRGWALAALLGVDINQVKNNPFQGEGGGPNVSLELISDFQLSPEILLTFNGGYRFRNQGEPIPNTGVEPLADQITFSGAMSYLLAELNAAVIAEFYGSFPLESISLPTDRSINTMEALVAYKWKAQNGLAVSGGLGSELFHGLSSPDIRLFAGVDYQFSGIGISANQTAKREKWSQSPDNSMREPVREKGFSDSDGDGVRDADDQCPSTPSGEAVDGFGC